MMTSLKGTKNREKKGGLVRLFALRYLFSKKSHTLINVISLISALSIAIPVAALIILMSVFGGLNSFVEQLNRGFDSDIRITSEKGRYFNPDSILLQIEDIDGIEVVSTYIEENALAKYDNAQTIVTMRGVDTLYNSVVSIEKMMKTGDYALTHGELNYAVIGMGVAYKLGVNVNLSRPLNIYVPSADQNSFIPTLSYRSDKLFPNSIFVCDAEIDGKYILVPLRFTQKLLSKEGKVTAIAIKSRSNNLSLIDKIQKRIGGRYKVESSYAQNETIYKIMQSEKRVVFFISLLVVLISSFSLAGSLIMLMADKKSQMQTVTVMGATSRFVERVFITQGVIISGVGIVAGTLLGVSITLIQQLFGVIKINSQTLLIDSYPVILSLSDVLIIIFSVAIINILITFVTVKGRVK